MIRARGLFFSLFSLRSSLHPSLKVVRRKAVNDLRQLLPTVWNDDTLLWRCSFGDELDDRIGVPLTAALGPTFKVSLSENTRSCFCLVHACDSASLGAVRSPVSPPFLFRLLFFSFSRLRLERTPLTLHGR